MLRITPRAESDEIVLRLEGCVAGAWAGELYTCWRGVVKEWRGEQVRVDLTDVCHVDDAGREVLRLMHGAGARFTACGCLMPEIVREIAESAGGGRQ